MWAVSRKKKFSDNSYDYAFGISTHNQWFPWGAMRDVSSKSNNINLNHFLKKRSQVDLLFDVDKRELRICLVGETGKDKEAIISNIEYPDKQNKGFVPHLNFGSYSPDRPIMAQIAKISVDLYGQPYDNIFTL